MDRIDSELHHSPLPKNPMTGWPILSSEARRKSAEEKMLQNPAFPYKDKVLPYFLRGATVRMVMICTGIDKDTIIKARQILYHQKEIDSSQKRHVWVKADEVYERKFHGKEIPPDIMRMAYIGNQLVKKGVLTENLGIWNRLLGEYSQQRSGLSWPSEFPARLILEGFLAARLEVRRPLEEALKRSLTRGTLINRFQKDFDFLTQVAEDAKSDSGLR